MSQNILIPILSFRHRSGWTEIGGIIFLIIFMNLSAIPLFPQSPVFPDPNLEGFYLGRYMEYISEEDIFIRLLGKQNLSPEAAEKILSGKLSVDRNWESRISLEGKQYKIELTDRLTGEESVFQWGIEDVILLDDLLIFTSCENKVPRIDFSEQAGWFRLTLGNRSPEPLQYLIELDTYFLSWFDVFQINSHEITALHGAFERPMSDRQVLDDRIVHSILLLPGENTLYFRIDGIPTGTVPVRIWSERRFRSRSLKSYYLHGSITALTILLFAYSVYLYFIFREKSHLLLSGLILTGFLVHISMSGSGFLMFWPERPHLSVIFLYLFYPLTIVFNIHFCRFYLKSERLSPFLDKILSVLIILAIVILPLPFISRAWAGSRLFGASLFLDYFSLVPLFLLSFSAYRHEQKEVRFLIVGLVFQALSYIEYWLSSFNIIPLQFISFLQIRTIGFAVLMFFGLSYRINHMKEILSDLKRKVAFIKPRGKTITTETEEKVRTVEEFISEKFKEPLTRESLAETVQMSPDHLGRMYLKLTGEKLSATINRYRIDFACRRLMENDDKIIDIAYESGFESLRTFNKYFSLVKGKSPKEYRNSKL